MFGFLKKEKSCNAARSGKKTEKSTIRHSRLGEIYVSRSRRARRITLSVKPDGTIRLSFPYSLSLQEGLQFLDEKAAWAEQMRERMAVRYPKEIIEMPFSTRSHLLRLLPGDMSAVSARIIGDEIRVSYPAALPCADERVQSMIRKGIEAAWRMEANACLPGRAAELARQTGLKYGKITVRNTVSKWGSCSARNDISLSLHLMRLPDHLIDYIILHELCHTVHHNHSPQFHALLDRLTGGRHVEFRREVRQYRTRW